MAEFFALLFIIVLAVLPLSLLFPSLYDKVAKRAVTRKQIGLTGGAILLVLFFLIALSTPSSNNKVSNTTKADSNITESPTPTARVKQWVSVIAISGSSYKRTDVFKLEGGKTKLTYTFSGDSSIVGAIYVIKEGHSLEKEGGFPEVNVSKAGTDSTFLT